MDLVFFVVGGLVVFGVFVYFVWRYGAQSESVANTIVHDVQSVTGKANTANLVVVKTSSNNVTVVANSVGKNT